MDDRELVTYANLMADGLDDSTLLDFAQKNNLSPDQRVQLGEDLDLIKDNVLFAANNAENIVEQYRAGKAKTVGESLSRLTGQSERTEGIGRKEAMDKIGKAGLAYLDKTNPMLYDEFQPYATMQGIEKLAGRQGIADPKTEQEKQYNARIMEARRLNQLRQERQDANMQQTTDPNEGRGFPSPPPPPTTPPGTQPPTTPPGASPIPAPPTAGAPIPFNYSQFPQFNMSDYARQGLGATPQFGDFQETLDRFFKFR